VRVACDAADWWDENRRNLGEWGDRSLSEFVETHPNFFAIVLATYARTFLRAYVEIPMLLTNVDFLRLGTGAAGGGWGYVRDALRFFSVIPFGEPVAGAAPGVLSRLLTWSTRRMGNCAWIAAVRALWRTGTKAFATLGDLCRAAKIRVTEGNLLISELIGPLERLGAKVTQWGQPKNMAELATQARLNPNGVFIFGLKWDAPSGMPAYHAMIAEWDSSLGLQMVDRSGIVVRSLDELEHLHAGISKAEPARGMIFIEDAAIPDRVGLERLAMTGNLLDAVVTEVRIIFFPTPEIVQAMRKGKPTVEIGEPTITDSRYEVKTGDSLSRIAQTAYSAKSDAAWLWPIIYDANRAVIGSNPNLIRPGQVFIIPDISVFSEASLENSRQRGRNWNR
jgi:LysM repeat protein